MPAPAPPSSPLPEPACPNCGHLFAAPRLRFCPACGQETDIKAPSVHEFMQQFSGTYFATEGALWRTLKLLLLKPGELTQQYLAGRRKHYVLPLRLFLSITVVMLLTMRAVSALNFATLDDPEVMRALPQQVRSIQLELGFGRAGLDGGQFYCEGLPGWLCKRLQTKLSTDDTRAMVLQMQQVTDRVASHASGAAFVLLPAFAFGLWLLFRQRGLVYTEHLVFALHLHAFWFLVLAVMLIGVEPLVWTGLLVVPAYGLRALWRVYGGPWWALLLRAGLLASVHLALVAVAVVAITLGALLL